jgi:hypothetical protein
MKKMVVSLVAALSLALVACTSVESAKVNSADIASSSDAVAVIQATELGFNLLWGFVPLADPSFDSVVNKSLIAEAKAMGGNKVEIVSMFRMNPDQFPFNFMPMLYLPGLLNINMAYATGVAVK